MQLIPTIISGGAGSRLWPASQAHRPKPFMKIGESGRSLLQQAFLRAAALKDVVEILTVTGQDLLRATQAEYRLVNSHGLKAPFILEPFGRNTAAAVAIAALRCVQAHGADSIMLVLPADHLIENQQAFADAVRAACEAAQKGLLAAFGIDPISAHTGYGYIEIDKAEPSTDWHGVRRFVEKPNQKKAEEFLKSGNYFWNSGIYCFKPGVLLQEMRQHCPEVVEAAAQCLSASMAMAHALHADYIELDSHGFSTVPSESIDVALMEKSRNIVVVHSRFAWNDIGSWSAIADITPKDSSGNSGGKNSVFYNSSGCFVYGGDRKIGIVGLEDIVVVDTDDGLLVAHRDQTQDVRHVHTKTGAAQLKSYGVENSEIDTWGQSKTIEIAENSVVKRLTIKTGNRISPQDSDWPAGPWLVAVGQAAIIGQDGRALERTAGEAYHCDPSDQEIINIGDGMLILIAVGQTSGNGSTS